MFLLISRGLLQAPLPVLPLEALPGTTLLAMDVHDMSCQLRAPTRRLLPMLTQYIVLCLLRVQLSLQTTLCRTHENKDP